MTKKPLPLPHSSVGRVALAVIGGSLVAAVVDAITGHLYAMLAAIGVATFLFALLGWMRLWPMTAKETRANALREDLNLEVEELVVVVAEAAALSAVVVLLLMGKTAENQIAAVMAVFAVFLSWAGLHLMYAIRYAGLYYAAPVGGIDFNSDEAPSYRDFLYFAYNLGMTYQVSDTAVSRSAIRSVVLRHCLLSYVFGTVVLASTVNLLVGFVSS